MAARASRTLNQLHFEDLEPHRFEDLIRQLIYDFRFWKRLEPTGRLGADDGIDIRGVETVYLESRESVEGADHEILPMSELLWVIQCKREKSIHPADIKRIIKEAIPDGSDPPFGFILAAACEFSKRSRDLFILELRDLGVEEFHLWGKGDLEDMLFQPKFDHLLYAYFGFSIQIRRRTMRNELRNKLATKKAIHRLYDGEHRGPKQVVIIDASASPIMGSGQMDTLIAENRIVFGQLDAFFPDMVAVQIGKFHAYMDRETLEWDAMFASNEIITIKQRGRTRLKNPWDDSESRKIREEITNIQNIKPCWFNICGCLDYNRILAIDEEGHLFLKGPLIYVEPLPKSGIFRPHPSPSVTSQSVSAEWFIKPERPKRIEHFPSNLREARPGTIEAELLAENPPEEQLPITDKS